MKVSMKTGAVTRRKSALTRLETQLEAKCKTDRVTGQLVPLGETDVKRIEKEISILKGRI